MEAQVQEVQEADAAAPVQEADIVWEAAEAAEPEAEAVLAAVPEAVQASEAVPEADSEEAPEADTAVPECRHHPQDIREELITDIGIVVRECPRHHPEVPDTDTEEAPVAALLQLWLLFLSYWWHALVQCPVEWRFGVMASTHPARRVLLHGKSLRPAMHT